MTRLGVLLSAAALGALAACGGEPARQGDGAAAERLGLGRPADSAAIAAVDLDVNASGAGLPPGRGSAAQGATMFQQKCSMCHGPTGAGMPPVYPTLVGRDPRAEGFRFASDPALTHTIGNYWPYATTIFDYIRRAMPLTAPGSLSGSEAYALTAYLLASNRILPQGAVLDSASLIAVKMPYASRFVPDDRRGGRDVK